MVLIVDYQCFVMEVSEKVLRLKKNKTSKNI